MDKKLLDALNNIAEALEYLNEVMKEGQEKKGTMSPTATALSSGKLEKKIEALDKGVKQIQSDNKKILKNQDQLLKLAQQKSEEKKSPVGDASDPKNRNKIKDGLATIMLIAVGVLAIGLAFKIIGQINFVAVLSLALALPIIAFAFERIAKMPGLTVKRMLTVVGTLVAMSIAMVLSSRILGMVRPVGIIKLLTAIMIAGVFVVLSFAMDKILEGFSKVKPMGAFKMILFGPAVLFTLSLAIMMASSVLSNVKPIGFIKLFTAALISATFVGLSYALPGIAEGFAKLGPMGVAKLVLFGPTVFAALANAIADSSGILGKVQPVGFIKLFTAVLISIAFAALGIGLGRILDAFSKMKINAGQAAAIAILMPILFVALAFAVTGASYAFSKIEVVSLLKMFTAIVIGIAFIPLSFAAALIAWGLSKITIKQAVMLPVILVLLATAIMLSSHIFNMTAILPWSTLWSIILQSVTLAIVGVALGLSIYVIKLLGIKVMDAIKGGIVLVIMAAVVMTSSLILSVGNYANYPTLSWILGVTVSLTVFAVAAYILGPMVFGPQALVMLAGLAAILVVSLVIVATSHILALGNYNTYPPVLWTLGVVLAMVPFALMAIVLGAIAMTGIGLVAFLAGIPMVLGVALTIVEVSKILQQGNYNLPGILPWTIGIVMLYTTFVPLLLVLGGVALMNAVLSVFGPNPWESARKMIVQIAETIVEVAAVFAGGNFTGGPTMEWAGGVAVAIGAFAPVYAMLVANNVMKAITGGGVGPDEFAQAIKTVVNGIVTAANELYKAGDAFKGGPPKEWAESVGSAIGAFAPVYSMLVSNEVFKQMGGKGGIGPEEFANAIMVVCTGIVDAAKFFGSPDNNGVFDLTKIPSKAWGQNVGSALSAFTPALEFISKNKDWWSGVDVTIVSKAIKATSEGIRDSSLYLRDGDYEGGVKKEWVTRTGDAIRAYVDFVAWLYTNDGLDRNRSYFLSVSKTIVDTANTLASGSYEDSITKEWMDNVGDATRGYVNLVFWVYSIDGLNDAMGYFPYVTSNMIRVAKDYAIVAQNARRLNPNWLQNLFHNIRYYIVIARYLSKRNVRFSTIWEAVWGLSRLTTAYTQLGQAVKKLNNELRELDVEKLNALKSFNSSVVLLSLMDPEQFRDMMDELEEKGGSLFKAIDETKDDGKKPGNNKIENKTQPVKTTTPTNNKTGGKTLDDIWNIMNTHLPGIAKDAQSIGSFVSNIGDELEAMLKRS